MNSSGPILASDLDLGLPQRSVRTIDLPGIPPFRFAVHAAPDRYISWSIANLGVWDPLETEVVRRALGPGDTFLDVGANIGWFTVLAAQQVGDSGAVWAFEPDPANYRLLRLNLGLSRLTWVQTEAAAAGSTNGRVDLYRSSDNLGDHRTYASEGVGDPIRVRVLRLEDYLIDCSRRLDLVKIDCQGAEWYVLEGFWSRLMEDRPSLILEFWPFGLEASGAGVEALLDRLEALAGRLFILDEVRGRLAATSIDSLYRRSQQDLHPSSGAHLDLFWQSRHRPGSRRLWTLL